ncbi:LysR family transcriptional regulator [Candidatus Enterococcus clewellii]|uniref:LysR family transcriptional regulator n=1 Tax=Candidatus Enterococcus clewellii TaxID=1834193 RepID=UPI0020169ABC|nr:LysR family transcriptional regulator [Enterococcus sp. 9E7_DIV0242]
MISLFKLLETFKTVYETLNFSEAAEILFVSQPTVSAQIKQLENELETSLFSRNGKKKIIPTPQAELLYKQSLNILEEWETTKQLVVNQATFKETVKIAASLTFGMKILPELLKELLAIFPMIDFKVTLCNSLDVLNAMNKHEADLGFIEMPLQTGTLKRTTLMSDVLVAAGDPNEELWLIRESTSGVYHYTKRYFEENNITGPFLEINSNELISKLLRMGIGRSIISALETDGLHTEPLTENYERNFYLLERDAHESETIAQCARFITRWVNQKYND